ncbi:acyltransferase family protein [Paraburkholderia acidiphila]|uniref:Acyltransferase family protein n=1 Tax=Paraburkholderia acidiphila TaxID=2571747 RepID=A0A7Z2G2W7_9BURK|nr:acyltransferase [Paraburkholderia acidiphila]QGZ54032.1 acyltransferase family protein [Paraburkholderia acidiphila]
MSGDLPNQPRYYALDALRFILASWVAIGHLGPFPFFAGMQDSSRAIHLIDRGINTIVWGMPAVITFFVISGFCVHIPFRDRRKLPLLRFYTRRYLRVTVPMLIALGVIYTMLPNQPLWGRHSVFWDSTLWSLLIEEIYYAVYPLVLQVRRRVGWTPVLCVAFAASIVTASRFPKALSWNDLGPLWTAVVLYPVWLLGCCLAERAASLGERHVSRAGIWRWRFAAWSVMWLAELANFHLHLSQVHTMMFVGIFAAWWLSHEISYSRHTDPPRFLRRAGEWSYSLYLIHPAVLAFYESIEPDRFANHPRLGWLAIMTTVFVASYAFYLVVERPSHALARRIPLRARDATALANPDEAQAERVQIGPAL